MSKKAQRKVDTARFVGENTTPGVEIDTLEIANALIAARDPNLTPENLAHLLIDEALDCGDDAEAGEYALTAVKLMEVYKLTVVRS
jgi:hypothetical protein